MKDKTYLWPWSDISVNTRNLQCTAIRAVDNSSVETPKQGRKNNQPDEETNLSSEKFLLI